jgi:hypothetical protein
MGRDNKTNKAMNRFNFKQMAVLAIVFTATKELKIEN